MNSLNPKAIWIFFFSNLLTIFILLFILSIFIIPLLSLINPLFFTFSSSFSLFVSSTFVFLIVWVALSYIVAYYSYKYWKYQLTDNAIKIEKGIISKKYISIPYERVQNVDIYRGVIARFLGLSDIHIQTAGYSSYRRSGIRSEGRLPGLDIYTAEKLREELVKRVKGTKQGL